MYIYGDGAWYSFMRFISGRIPDRHADHVYGSDFDRLLVPSGIETQGKLSHRVLCTVKDASFFVSLCEQFFIENKPHDFVIDPIRLRDVSIDLNVTPTAYYETSLVSQAYLFDNLTESQMMEVRLRLF